MRAGLASTSRKKDERKESKSTQASDEATGWMDEKQIKSTTGKSFYAHRQHV